VLKKLDKNMKHRCPVCQKTVNVSSGEQTEAAKFFPFCCERCKLIDLGAWLDARYKITSELQKGQQESDESPDDSSGAPLDSR